MEKVTRWRGGGKGRKRSEAGLERGTRSGWEVEMGRAWGAGHEGGRKGGKDASAQQQNRS